MSADVSESFVYTVVNPAFGGTVRGLRVILQQVPYQTSRITVRKSETSASTAFYQSYQIFYFKDLYKFSIFSSILIKDLWEDIISFFVYFAIRLTLIRKPNLWQKTCEFSRSTRPVSCDHFHGTFNIYWSVFFIILSFTDEMLHLWCFNLHFCEKFLYQIDGIHIEASSIRQDPWCLCKDSSTGGRHTNYSYW